MRAVLAGVLAVCLATTPAMAEVGEADRAAIEATIRGQIEAFRRDDAVAAHAFASRTVQGLFATPELFLAMVRRAYAPLYRATELRFRPAEAAGGAIRQPVVVRGPDGRSWLALYSLERQADGSFRIDRCVLIALPDAGA